MLYKLTDPAGYTQRGREHQTLWGPGVTNTAARPDLPAKLCDVQGSVIHAYEGDAVSGPWLAVLMDPAHAWLGRRARLWRAEGKVVVRDATKAGCRTLTTVEEVEKPEPTLAQRVAFGILSALEGNAVGVFRKWARGWLSGEDRSRSAAYDADAVCYAAGAAVPYAIHAAALAATSAGAGAAAHATSAAASTAARAKPDIDLAGIARRVALAGPDAIIILEEGESDGTRRNAALRGEDADDE